MIADSKSLLIAVAALAAALALASGCGKGEEPKPTPIEDGGHAHTHGDGHGHSHDDSGKESQPSEDSSQGHAHSAPHGGVVVTMGDLHGELVSSPDGKLVFYMLDADQAKNRPLATASLTMQAQDATTELVTPITLTANPQPGEAAGSSSRFAGQLPDTLRGKQVALTLDVDIDGQPRRAQFEVTIPAAAGDGHDHDGHKH